MTVGVDADLRIREYPGDDSATARAVPFYFLDADDLKVTRVNADGSETVLVRGTNYSVAGAGNPAGGSVTPLAPIATGTTWRIEGDMTLAQPTDYTAGDDFPAESHERALDRAMIGLQEARRDLNDTTARALLVPRGETFGALPPYPVRAGAFLAFDANGQPTMASGTGADSALRGDLADAAAGAELVARSAVTVNYIVDLLVAPVSPLTTGFTYVVRSYRAGISFGGGEFYWDNARAKSSHNGGTVISPSVPWDGAAGTLGDFLAGVGETDPGGSGCWIRVNAGMIEAEWWGAHNDVAANAAIAFSYTTSNRRVVRLAAGDWDIATPLLLAATGMNLVGDGPRATILNVRTGALYGIDIGDGATYIDTIAVRHFSILGSGATDLVALIRSRRAQKKLSIEGNEFRLGRAASTGFLATECWGLSLVNNNFMYCGRAVDLSGPNSGRIWGNYFINNARENLVIDAASNVDIRANAFETYSTSAVGTYYNVNLTNLHASVIESNWFESSAADAAHLNVQSSCARISVRNNTIFGSSLSGHLMTMAAPNSVISHNRLSISNPARVHIQLAATATRAVVEENAIMGSSGAIQDNTAGDFFADRKRRLSVDSAYDPPSLATGTSVTTTVALAAATMGDVITAVSFSQNLAGVDLTAWVSAAGVVSVKFANNTGGPVDLASGFIRIRGEAR